MTFFKKLMVGWLMTGLVFWTFLVFDVSFVYQLLYLYFILFFVGVPIWFYREKIKIKLQGWKLNNFAKFLFLGLFAVLFEETFAALFNHLSEGFNFIILLQRIGQFWAFNVLAFVGFYLAWYFLLREYRYSYTEVFFIAGIYGVFAEQVFYEIFKNQIYVFFTAPIMIFVYGIMITLPMLSIELSGKTKISLWAKTFLSLALIFLFSIIPILVLQLLRVKYPSFFPPAGFIPM